MLSGPQGQDGDENGGSISSPDLNHQFGSGQNIEPSTKKNTLHLNTQLGAELLSPTSEPSNQAGELPRPLTPTVHEEDPSGNKKIIHQDGDSGSIKHENFYHHRTESESSFASIKTIQDLGFTRQVATDSAATQVSASLHPTPARLGRTDSNASSADSEGKSAQDRLSKIFARSYLKSKALQCNDKDFLPINDIESILSRENVQEVLMQEIPRLSSPESKEELQGLLQKICGRERPRRRIFTLLILGDKVECIECFIECDIDDTDLPFVGIAPESDLSSLWVYSRKDANRQLKCFRKWRRTDIEWLLHKQHVVAPPFFDLSPKRLFLYDLPEDAILPFTEYKIEDEGGYGSVFKVLIHPAHHNFPTQRGAEDPYFAVKTLHKQYRDDYEREVEVLQRFSGKNPGHPHLIRLLLTYMYKHKGSYHMIFPWADGGNLRNLWESVKPERTQTFACWMVSQYHGIADGLRVIHGNNHELKPNDKNKGRHGDIKAENILWIKDHHGKKDHLLISDFGLSRFHSFKSQSIEARVPGCSPSYRPPECDLPRVRISVSYDMWTLGCLFLDFLTWYLLGWEGVEKLFADARMMDEGWTGSQNPEPDKLYEDKFFKQDRYGANEIAELKPSVIDWMEKLHNLPDCPEFAHDILKIIHEGLLHPDKTKRWDCSIVVGELDKIQQRCNTSEEYCLEPHKWEGGRLKIFQVRYSISAIASLNEGTKGSQQRTGYPSPGSLSPVSGPSRSSTPPPESQGPESLGADPLDITSAPLEPAVEPSSELALVTPGTSPLKAPVQNETEQNLNTEVFTSINTTDSNASQPLPPDAGDPENPRMAKRMWGGFKQRAKHLCCCFRSD